uniref:Uncharacterized protein n=1 Tax=Anguilla anguilla TaxID=7936 RepID=A0A0E9RU26_ANGAN
MSTEVVKSADYLFSPHCNLSTKQSSCCLQSSRQIINIEQWGRITC